MDDIYGDKWIRLLGNMAPIHPDTVFGKDVRIGEGVIIEEGCEIGDNSLIGHYCVLRPRTKIGHDTVIGHLTNFEGDTIIGNNVLIHAQCHITQGVIIEDQVFMGPTVTLINTAKIKHGRNFPLITKGPIIRYGVRIGARTLIMPGREIGREALIGGGSVVTKNIPAKECWVGTPAKLVRMVPEDELI